MTLMQLNEWPELVLMSSEGTYPSWKMFTQVNICPGLHPKWWNIFFHQRMMLISVQRGTGSVEQCICAFFLGLFHHGSRCCARKEIREKTLLWLLDPSWLVVCKPASLPTATEYQRSLAWWFIKVHQLWQSLLVLMNTYVCIMPIFYLPPTSFLRVRCIYNGVGQKCAWEYSSYINAPFVF